MSELLKAVHDPEENERLKALADKIGALIAEADVGGYVCLQGMNTAHYRFFLQPSWSCLLYESRSDGSVVVRFKAAIKTGGPEEKARANVTMGMLLSLAEQLGAHSEMTGKLAGYFGKHFDAVEHISERPK